ncbi:reverse transcriptase [Metarhizium guizhouense ARSEF 977]|uniref:Reverse transcriptase n=1 Tax=Metarhizium guizhouense (strain ARSEF 977) TaxID=1276136 RepID=A0A0B4HUP9_METGA|nr:reverse transcriptase [Metarhizium guizhouense ARSEF 977]
MIPKPGKRNLSCPRAWRPISLLSCLGKGLERLIARRLAWASIHYAVLHPQQAGALPKRSAVDLVAALIHDIEEAFARGEVATLVTADIQGAFDTAMCNRLVLRLREQGWQDNLARWAGSFMSGRSARVRYQDITTPTTPLQCGLPQGSPVSPILFLLYTEPIYRLGNPEGRFGYADDTAILCTGPSLEETSRTASEYLQELVNWGAANGISFDPKKTEVMHFSPRRRETEPPVRHGDVEKQPEAAMRWLGLWLDRKLTFKTHVETWTAKAQAVSHHLRSLGNTRRGALPSAVQRAVRACVEPILLFGVEAWYPDHAHPLAKRTTEAAPRPIIKCIKLKYQLPPKSFPTRLRRTNRLLGNCQRPVLIPRKYSHEPQQPLQTASKEESAKDFDRWLQTIPPLSLIVYSDGSLSSSGAAGYGYVVHQSGRSVCQGAGRLGPAEVFDAEAKGALEGLKAALRLTQSATQRIVVCLDNIAAAKCLRGKPSDSSQRVFLTFQALAKTHRKTEVRWIPGHTKIPGNEQADILAKTGCAEPEPADAVPTLAFLRKTARQRSKIAVQAWWDASAPDKYQSLTLKFPYSCPPELALPRTMLNHLLAARTHHGDFADYHERFQHNDACVTCSCGRRKAPTHLFYCRKIQPRCRMRLAPSPTVAINQALGRDFDKFVKLTDLENHAEPESQAQAVLPLHRTSQTSWTTFEHAVVPFQQPQPCPSHREVDASSHHNLDNPWQHFDLDTGHNLPRHTSLTSSPLTSRAEVASSSHSSTRLFLTGSPAVASTISEPSASVALSQSFLPNHPDITIRASLQAIFAQETGGSRDFLDAQQKVDDGVFRTFFDIHCRCSSETPRDEPENSHTLRERVQYLQRYLPPISTVFGPCGSYDPSASFPQWQSFLSDQPAEPLSFSKTQDSLPESVITIERLWDIDSVWFGAKSLQAIRPPNDFRLCFLPPFQRNISTDQVIQPHGLSLAGIRPILLGVFNVCSVRFEVFVYFPGTARSPRSKTQASRNGLSLERQKDFYDKIIIPAAYETISDPARQEIPRSYDIVYAKSRAFQEKPGTGRWLPEDESRAFQLRYTLPAQGLPPFWKSVVEKANAVEVATQRGENIRYFHNPQLLFQAHDLKNTITKPSLKDTLTLFRDTILAAFDPDHLDLHSCWLDIGARDYVSTSSPSTLAGPGSYTLLWKSHCLADLDKQLPLLSAESPMASSHFRSFLLRDVGTYVSKAKSTRGFNPGHPEGCNRLNAYNKD